MAERRYQMDPRQIRYDSSGLDGTPRKKTYSWAPIIIFMFIFWPVGIVLLIRKMKNERSAMLKNGKTVFGIGIFLAVMAVFLLISFASGSLTTTDGRPYPMESFVTLFLFFGGGGVALIVVGTRMKKTGMKYRRYINLVVNNRLTSIDQIASAVGCSYDQAIVDLQKMQEDGYFSHAYIDFAGGTFYLNGDPRETSRPSDYGAPVTQPCPSAAVQSAPTVQVVTCKSCGAQNTVPTGKVCECEYCGSPIG